jgi:chromosome partition protein MukB
VTIAFGIRNVQDPAVALDPGNVVQNAIYLSGGTEWPVGFDAWEGRARETLERPAYDYVAGGAGAEETMRANLDACRRTRTEVQEARALEREISGVYEAGATMFGAALAALQAEVDEAARSCATARSQENAARFALAEAEAAHVDGSSREAAARARVTEARARLDADKARRETLERAADLARRCEVLAAELAPAEADASAAKLELGRAEEARENEKREVARARETYDKAARGLANQQGGLE